MYEVKLANSTSYVQYFSRLVLVRGGQENLEQLVDAVAGGYGMAEGTPGRDGVAVAPPVPGSGEVAARLEVGDDLLGGPLGNGNEKRHLAQRDIRIASDGEQDMGVVCQEGPSSFVARLAVIPWSGIWVRHVMDSSPGGHLFARAWLCPQNAHGPGAE